MPINQTVAYVFDGIELKKIFPDNDNRLIIHHNVSEGYHGVVFITGEGHFPVVVPFKSTGGVLEIKSIKLQMIKDKRKGILTGVVYTPVVGGKLREHRGIKRLFSDEEVRIFNNKHLYTVKTDKRGVFTILLPEGEYSITSGSKQAGKIRIKSGRTTIKNIQKGLVLID
ncbi:MAG: hypothetical protein GXO97_08295 [Nitrospirae bacterium]|nr:hypothetical protein [Nitrospirota bacterium]